MTAATPWLSHPDVTGGEPVIHLHGTKANRIQAARMSEEAGVKYAEVKSGLDICPIGKGDYDSEYSSIDGRTASNWLKHAVHTGGYEFHQAHSMLARRTGNLPCEKGSGCPSKRRWNDLPRDDDKKPNYDVIHATYDFSYLENLIEDSNIIFDEQPSFSKEVYLKSIGTFIENSLNQAFEGSARNLSWVNFADSVIERDTVRLEEYKDFLSEYQPGDGRGRAKLHRQTRAIGKAISEATSTLDGLRYVGHGDNTSVVLGSQGVLRQIHQPPDLSKARCVVGLDAYPSLRLWELNAGEDLQYLPVLTPDEKKLWRRERRKLHVVRVGRDVRSYTEGWRGNVSDSKAQAIIRSLTRKYGSAFRTSISSKAIEGDVRRMLVYAGAQNPETLHFGDLKSRNDFDGEEVGLVVGCNDPGDNRILDMLGLCGLEALPEYNDNGERGYGRKFVGPDADAAANFLASVREHNLTQAVGRYARHPDDESSGAKVYVWSAALPEPLTDEVVPGVISRVTDLKAEIKQHVLREGTVTKKEVAEEVDTAPSYAYEVLQELAEQGIVEISEGTGAYGAHEYIYVSGTLLPSVDLGF